MSDKILLLGNTGQLGWELQRVLLPLGHVTALDYPEIDMANPDHIRTVCRAEKPNLIINATAYTNVDQAESEPALAMAINGEGPGILAEEARSLNAVLIHYSTDYVFDGKKGSAYSEADVPRPLNCYGRTKLAGEKAIQEVGGKYLIFRTSWVYSLRRVNFMLKVLQWAREKEVLSIVDDQISTPTWARQLAETTAVILSRVGHSLKSDAFKKYGLYHLTSGGACSRYDWAKKILSLDPEREKQVMKKLQTAKTTDFSQSAERPLNTHLDCQKIIDTFGIDLPGWETCLTLMMDVNS